VKTKKCGNCGFTFIELLVVIAIVSTLVCLLLPALSRGKSRVRSIQCRNNLRQIGVALISYTQNNGSYPLFGRPSSASEPNGAKWFDDLAPELSETWWSGVYICPEFGLTKTIGWSIRATEGYVYDSFGSYGYNGGSADEAGRQLYGLAGRIWGRLGLESEAVPESAVRNPSGMIALADSFAHSHAPFRKTPISEGSDFLSRRVEYPGVEIYPHRESRRHRGVSHVAFTDGHVEANAIQRLLLDIDDAALSRWHRDNESHRELFP